MRKKLDMETSPIWFGGTAFKYQRQPLGLELTTKNAAKYIDIVTTSGVGTGRRPEVKKIKYMCNVLDDKKRIAIASGMTPDNISDFLPFAHTFIVSTGVSFSNGYTYTTEFDPKLLEKFMQKIS